MDLIGLLQESVLAVSFSRGIIIWCEGVCLCVYVCVSVCLFV